MASFDEVCRTIWDGKELGLLASTCVARAALSDVPEGDRVPFVALTDALLSWWPSRKPASAEIYAERFGPCLAIFGREPKPQHLTLVMQAAYQEMAALRRISAPGMPADGYQDLGVEDFVKLAKAVLKPRRTTSTRLKAQFEHLLGLPRQWPVLRAAAAAMPFERAPGDPSALTPQLEELVKFLDLGATWSWSMMGPKHALKVELGSTKRTAMLDEPGREALLRAAPWLANG